MYIIRISEIKEKYGLYSETMIIKSLDILSEGVEKRETAGLIG